MYFPRWV